MTSDGNLPEVVAWQREILNISNSDTKKIYQELKNDDRKERAFDPGEILPSRRQTLSDAEKN